MKKIFLLAAAAMVMVGCAQNEEVYTADAQQEIALKAYTATSSRALIDADATMQNDHTLYSSAWYQGVGAGASANVYFKNIPFSYTDAWHGNPNQYYPVSGKIDFMAYSVEKTLTMSDTNATWTIAANDASVVLALKDAPELDGAHDVLFSNRTEAFECPSSGSKALTMRHALSRLEFNVATTAPASTVIKLNSIVVKAPLSGNVTIDYNAVNTLATVEWPVADLGTVVDTTLEGPSDALTRELVPVDILLVAPSVPAETATLTINYSINGINSSYEISLKDKPAIWLPETKYIYNLSIAPNEITYTATVSAWLGGATDEAYGI